MLIEWCAEYQVILRLAIFRYIDDERDKYHLTFWLVAVILGPSQLTHEEKKPVLTTEYFVYENISEVLDPQGA